MMKVWHGSYTAIKEVDLSFGGKQTDYAAVSEESTGYHRKPWQEIYEMLRAELKI